MALSPGTRVGSYEILSPLGAGGMGEVYRARDTKLGRDVALKILPDAFAQDRERLARFEREARTLASLNHPNIAQIYGIEDEGAATAAAEQRAPIRALVMELVEGDDLAQRLKRGALPMADALPIARQIADALEAAHEQGIIHRDLKPANVKVRPDGTVKVLDFGLAKAMDVGGLSGADGGRAENSPTMTSPAMTQQGFIIGTAAYMSPEQAKGKPVDRRADIWAFGIVLYELLTGRFLFAGETVSETLAAVIRQDVDLAALPADTPPVVRRLIARCLDRDPRTRLRDVGEARVVLSGPMAPQPDPTTPAIAQASPRTGSSWWTPLVWLAMGLVAGGFALYLATPRGSSGADRPPTFTLSRLTELPGPEVQPDMSPDGRQILYTSAVTGNRDVYLLRVGGARAISLTPNSPADESQARFSPSGDQIVFRSERDGGGLFLMGATGESVRRLTSAGYDPAWSPDGRFIAYALEAVEDPYSRQIFAELWTIEVASGKATKLFAGDAVQPAWSPDGSRIAFWRNDGGQRDIWTIAAIGGVPDPVTKDAPTDWSPEWSPDGRWLYFESDRSGAMNVWRIPIDQATGRAQGDAQPVTNGLRALGYGRFSRDGARMVVMGHDAPYDITVADFDPDHPDRIVPRTTLRNQSVGRCDPSPDGTWLACARQGAREDIVLLRASGTETRALMDDVAKDRMPTWSPDGQTLGFYSTRSGRWETWTIRPDGSDLRQVTNLDKDTGQLTWAPDGKRAIVAAVSTRVVLNLDPSRLNTQETATFLRGPVDAGLLDVHGWSPSGTLLSGLVFKDALPVSYGVWDLQTQTLQTLDVAPSGQGFDWSAFLPDSRRLLVGTTTGLVLVDLADGKFRQLLAGDGQTLYRLSRDGRTIVIQRRVFDADIWLMEFAK